MFTLSIKRACEIRKFYVAVVQRRQRNVQIKSVMHVQSCCFVNIKTNYFFAVLLVVAVVVCFIFIQR